MITKEMVTNGYTQGIIKLDIDPNMEAGTIARIGENWFYFGGLPAEGMNPEEYAATVPEEEIIDEIFEVLQEFPEIDSDEYAYYEAYLTEHCPVKESAGTRIEERSHWSEIRCDYIDEDDMFWRVDAWKTGDDSEEGSVIAYIDDITGRVLYTDPLARVDKNAQEVIRDKIQSLQGLIRIRKNPADIEIKIPTHHGMLVADIEPKDITGADYDAIYIGLETAQDPDMYLDLAAARSHDNDILDILVWKDIYDEDYTEKTEIHTIEIKELINNNKD